MKMDIATGRGARSAVATKTRSDFTDCQCDQERRWVERGHLVGQEEPSPHEVMTVQWLKESRESQETTCLSLLSGKQNLFSKGGEG